MANKLRANPGVQSKPKSSSGEDLFQQRLDQVASEIEILLDRLLAPEPVDGELGRPARLLEAMRYACLGGGKRFRPFLVVESAGLFDFARERALMAAAALECVHCYSLVHDDLPAMDNDDLRRGRPTVHKAFDEASAILAGDGLLTLAFDILSRDQVHPNARVRIELISALARAAGVGGMAGGQMLDLAAEGRFTPGGPQSLGAAETRQLQAMKTGALLWFACLAGAILGEAGVAERTALHRYGCAIGEAFQIADDLLDIEGDPATLGKATGKDAAAHKATLVGVLGVERAREKLSLLVAEAETALAPFGAAGLVLKAAARFVANRRA
jgi:farnesyl diphosphate synthase